MQRTDTASPMNATASATSPSNRLGLDYAAEARRLGPPPTPIIDAHLHIGGDHAARILKRAAELYGVESFYSMTPRPQVDRVREIFGPRVRFIAVPNWRAENRLAELTTQFPGTIEWFHSQGCRIVKFWAAPRAIDIGIEAGSGDMLRLDSPARLDAMQTAVALGMYFMVHVADPDTWFKGKYADAAKYGTKRRQYEPLEELLDRFTQPWIAAHLGGWPEDLEFLTGLLDRHANLYLDTSATKWIVREVSKHSRDEVIAFLKRFQGRILFGSDIVTAEEHISTAKDDNEMSHKASDPNEAFDLYASRYWALRTLWETDYDGPSPIADPDLHIIDPDRYSELDAPPLTGKALPADLLRSLYRDAAFNLLEPLHRR